MMLNEDEPIVATQEDDESVCSSISFSGRTKTTVISKSEAPLEKTKFKVKLELELMGKAPDEEERPRLDLVTAVQDLKVTFTQENSTIENVSAGNYPQSNGDGSVTVSLGDLNENVIRKVTVELLLPAVSSPQNGLDVLEITHSYSVGGELIEVKPIIASVNRIGISQELAREEIRLQTAKKIKEARIMADNKQLEKSRDMIKEAQTWLEDEVVEPKQLIKMLKYELQQLFNLMKTQDIYDNLGRSFAVSCETSHDGHFSEKGPSSRTNVTIINKTEAPLEETKFTVMLQLKGIESGNQRLGLDLVMVLDVSRSMKGEKLKEMKNAMRLVIKKLRLIDRLSVVTFSSNPMSLCPLCHINENSRAGFGKLVNEYLVAQDQGPGDISAGLEMGLKVLDHRMYTSGRVVAIMLLSASGQNSNFPDATVVEVAKVPIYTFGLGSNTKLLKSIAENSSGGTFTNVQNLSKEFPKCLAQLLTVEVQDLKVTFKNFNSEIKNVYARNYPQSRNDSVGSVTVSFGNLYEKEPRNVEVDLLLPKVSSTDCNDILGISYTYRFGGELICTKPRIVTITRRNSARMINEARVVTDKQIEVANKMICETQKLLKNEVDETLKSEVQQLKRLMNSQKLHNEQESDEVTIDEIHLLTAESGEGTIRSSEASTVHSNNDVKKKPIEFLLDRTGVRQRIPQSLEGSKNYTDWSEKVKKDLENLNLWKVIKEPPTETTGSIENVDMGTAIKKLRQFRENWTALILIKQACGFPINLQIIDLDSARAAWETLSTNWEQVSGVEDFLRYVERGDWKNAERLLDSSSNRQLATARIPSSQNTVLQLAFLAREVNIVKKFVDLMVPQDLEIKDKDGYTALAKASIDGDTRIAKYMVQKNERLVSIPTARKLLPVVIAVMNGHKQMTSYLYSATPLTDLTNEHNKGNINGATLLTYSIRMKLYDISFDLIRKCPCLAVALDHNGLSALYRLACTPSAFLSGSKLKFWKKWMYNCVHVPKSNWRNAGSRGIEQLIVSGLRTISGIKGIYEMKLVHHKSRGLLDLICQQIKNDLEDDEINGIINALHEAATRGVVEFVVGVLKKFPEFRWLRDKEGSTIFMKAVQFRQADIFCLIHGFPSKDKMVVLVDKYEENIFHKLKYSSVDKISTIQGGLIKMQTELKWLEEIKSMMPPDSLKKQNKEKKTAQQLFDESHEDLMMYAEMGMKKTSESCIIVGILVVTIMFAAVFTVPGGNNQDTGLPLFLNINLFKIFIISVAVSLCFSTASVLMFLGILTSRYARKDFLEPLPRKMIIALLTLFISITAMMVAFTVTLFIMLRSELRISLPIIVSLASFPVILSAIFMFPLLSEYIMSTYGPSIFKRKSKLLLSG